MRGRTFRRPLTTTRDGRARGRGGRLPGDESLTCPPLAAAHRSTARRGASAGRPVQLSAAASAHAADRPPRRPPPARARCPSPLDTLSPSAPTDGDTLTVSGTVTNNGKQTVTDAHVGLRVGQRADHPLGDRQRRQAQRLRPGRRRLGGRRQVRREVLQAHSRASPSPSPSPCRSTSWTSAATASTRSPSRSPARPPRSRGSRCSASSGPSCRGSPTRRTRRRRRRSCGRSISTVHMTAETGSNEQQTPVFLNDDLAKEISPGGRLDQMLSLGKDLDVTWVIDPDLLASVDAMTRSYRVQGDGDTTTAGTAPGGRQAVARRAAAGGGGQGGRGPALRRPGPGLPRPQRHERHRLAEPSQGGHRRRREHGGDRSST